MHARSIWRSVKLASDRHLLVEGHLQTRLRKESSMRTSTFRTITASFAALAVIVSLGTSPVLARGGWGRWPFRRGRRPFRRRRDVHGRRIWRGWFSRRPIWRGRENVRRHIQPSPLLRRLQRLCGEPVQSVAIQTIFVALYVLKRGEASPTRPQRRVLGQRRGDGVVGGSDGDADHALTAFRYFVGFHSRAIRCASAI